jgi:hypothetical protein
VTRACWRPRTFEPCARPGASAPSCAPPACCGAAGRERADRPARRRGDRSDHGSAGRRGVRAR